MEFMHEGGWGMWAMLVVAIGVVGYGITREKHRRPAIFAAGALVVLALGILGMTTGMEAVAAGIARQGADWPRAGHAVGLGLGELANDGTFGVALAAFLGLGALVTRPKQAA